MGNNKIPPIRVLIADDHVVVRRGIQMLLDTEPAIQVVGEAENCRETVDIVKDLQPDVVLMDLVMPMGDGVEAIGEIKGNCPDIKVIVLTTFADEPRIRAALDAGADGYLLKDADGDTLLDAIEAASQGQMPMHPYITQLLRNSFTRQEVIPAERLLTEREKDVLQLVAKGMSNKAIAQSLGLCEGTVKVHVSNILSKLDVSSRTEAIIRALQMGLVSIVDEG